MGVGEAPHPRDPSRGGGRLNRPRLALGAFSRKLEAEQISQHAGAGAHHHIAVRGVALQPIRRADLAENGIEPRVGSRLWELRTHRSDMSMFEDDSA